MRKHHPDNERIKRAYRAFLKEAKRQSEASVDAVTEAIARFEEDTKYRDFRSFQPAQAVAFKRHLCERESKVTGARLSKATLYATLSHLKRFFQWLAQQPGYKSKLTYTDAEFFNLSEKESRVATAKRDRPAPTLEQFTHVIRSMPFGTEIEQRNRALIAFALLTGARDGALASLKLKHVDLVAGCVHQDARDVKTKFSKTFTTTFFPVGDEVREIAEGWVAALRAKLWGNEDPLFPATRMELGVTKQFEAVGLNRVHWSNAEPIRKVFRQAFGAAGLPYFNPHSVRRTLAQLGQTLCQTPEEVKAWSQNLGHDDVMTTFTSYGSVAPRRQNELIKALATPRPSSSNSPEELVAAVALIMQRKGLLARPE